MSSEQSNQKIDVSQASEKPTSVTPISQTEQPETSETLPDAPLQETQNQGKNVVDDQIIIANLHGG